MLSSDCDLHYAGVQNAKGQITLTATCIYGIIINKEQQKKVVLSAFILPLFNKLMTCFERCRRFFYRHARNLGSVCCWIPPSNVGFPTQTN